MARTKKKRASAPKPKPGFACALYPKCPAHFETRSSQLDDGDEEEGFGATQSFYSEETEGPCETRCCEAPQHISHTVISIVGGRIVDIGS